MFAKPLWLYGPIKKQGVLAITNGNIGQFIGCLPYSTDKKSDKKTDKCCKEVAQTEGKRVEPWPKDPPLPPCWRYECPRDPQPPNYDPYRIKVPDVVVPPLPPSNAKWVLWTEQDENLTPQQQQRERTVQEEEAEAPKEESFMGMLRGLFDKIRGKSKRGDDAMMIGY